ERDDKEVARWVGDEFPRIVRQAWQRSAYLAFVDESGFFLTPTVRRTLAPRGKRPVLDAWDRRGPGAARSVAHPRPPRGRGGGAGAGRGWLAGRGGPGAGGGDGGLGPEPDPQPGEGGEGVAGGAPRGGGRGLPRVRPGPEPGRGRVGVDQVRAAGEPGGPRQGRVVGLGGGLTDRGEVPARPAPGVHPPARGSHPPPPPARRRARRLNAPVTSQCRRDRCQPPSNRGPPMAKKSDCDPRQAEIPTRLTASARHG